MSHFSHGTRQGAPLQKLISWGGGAGMVDSGQEIKEGIQGGNLTLILYWSELAENFNITRNIKNLSH